MNGIDATTMRSAAFAWRCQQLGRKSLLLWIRSEKKHVQISAPARTALMLARSILVAL
jgi:hypothetical protein